MPATRLPRSLPLGVAFAIALALSPATAEETDAPLVGPGAETFTLDNGMEVVVIPDRRAPVVTHMVWYKVGSADEPDGQTGIAHFLEHLMFKGTSTHPEGEFSRVVSEIGGDENAFTSSDYTGYFQRVARDKLELVMSYEADRMSNLVLSDAAVAPERKVVLEERAMRMEGEPGAQLGAAMDAVLYLRHPYGVPVIGWREDIEGLDREDAIAFYNRYYTPNNAVLVVAGDVTVNEVLAAAKETYGKVARRAEPPPRQRIAARELDIPREVSVSNPKVTVESVRMSWLAPSYRLAEPGEAEALDVLAEALGGGSTSLLFKDLVVDRKIATSVGIYYRSNTWDMGTLSAYIVPRDGMGLEAAKAELLAAIDRAVNALDEDEVARAKSRLEADTIYAQDSQQRMARIFGASLVTGSTVEDVQTWPARIRAVTLADVKSAAAAELDPSTSVTGYLRKASEEQRS
ncbi:MAG TPA: pitrilysin family protein [Methylomirabilota bacterium]|nr:pitrilysin family protein [Methylomirabilota bacterium]